MNASLNGKTEHLHTCNKDDIHAQNMLGASPPKLEASQQREIVPGHKGGPERASVPLLIPWYALTLTGKCREFSDF